MQKMTKAFVKKYFDEAHAVVPLPDSWVNPPPIDKDALDSILNEIAQGGYGE